MCVCRSFSLKVAIKVCECCILKSQEIIYNRRSSKGSISVMYRNDTAHAMNVFPAPATKRRCKTADTTVYMRIRIPVSQSTAASLESRQPTYVLSTKIQEQVPFWRRLRMESCLSVQSKYSSQATVASRRLAASDVRI